MRIEPAELQRIFTEEIAPQYFYPDLRPDETPTVVLVGGQPGAGKTQATRRITDAYPNIVPISGDNLRAFHPRYAELLSERPLEAGPVLAEATSVWVRNAIDHARVNRYSLMLEGTFHTPRLTLDTIANFSRSGYRTQITAIATPRRDSLSAAAGRYYREHEAKRAPRWTPLTAHDRGWRGTRDLLSQITSDSGIDRVTIMTREDTIYDAALSDYDAESATTALDKGRAPTQSNGRSLLWLAELRAYTDYAIRAGQVTRESAPVLVELHNIAINEITPSLKLPADSEARDRLLDRLTTTRTLIAQTANQAPGREDLDRRVTLHQPDVGGPSLA